MKSRASSRRSCVHGTVENHAKQIATKNLRLLLATDNTVSGDHLEKDGSVQRTARKAAAQQSAFARRNADSHLMPAERIRVGTSRSRIKSPLTPSKICGRKDSGHSAA